MMTAYIPQTLWCLAGVFVLLLAVCMFLRLLHAAAKAALAVVLLALLACLATVLWGEVEDVSPDFLHDTRIENMYRAYRVQSE